MPDRPSKTCSRAKLLRAALARWDNEGGAGPGRNAALGSATPDAGAAALPLTNAELVRLQVRVIALENVVMALLSEATDTQIELAREMAQYISPRPGHTAHPLTIHAAVRMLDLIEGPAHFREPPAPAASVSDAADAGEVQIGTRKP